MPVIETLAAALLAGPAYAQTDVSGRLVPYPSQPNENAQRTVEAFNAVHPSVQV